jgi:hypothetical protein
MRPIGILAVVLWGLVHLPNLTGLLLVLFLFVGAVVFVLDQFGLLPRDSSGRRR